MTPRNASCVADDDTEAQEHNMHRCKQYILRKQYIVLSTIQFSIGPNNNNVYNQYYLFGHI